jgi:hypothetical protein
VVLVDRRDGRHQLWSADPGAAERLQGVPGVVAAWGSEARRVIVSADDATALSSRLPRWVAAWSALPGVRAVASDSPPPRPSLDLVVDGAAAAAHQLSAAEVSRAAAAALAGLPMDGEVSRVRWGLGLDAPLPTALGLAPLSTWVEVTRGVDAPSSRVDGRPAATFWVTGGDPAGWAATAEGLVVTVDETRR